MKKHNIFIYLFHLQNSLTKIVHSCSSTLIKNDYQIDKEQPKQDVQGIKNT